MLVLLPGGAQKHTDDGNPLGSTGKYMPWPMAAALKLSAESCRYHIKAWRCTVLTPICSHPTDWLRTFSSCEKLPKKWTFTLFFMGRVGKFLHWVSLSLRQWRAWSNTSERIKFHFFSSHFTFCENCIFMSVNSQVGTRWQLSFPGNQEINQAAKMRWLHCEILLTFQKVVLRWIF